LLDRRLEIRFGGEPICEPLGSDKAGEKRWEWRRRGEKEDEEGGDRECGW
jgi:hypothetical protein